MLISRPAFIAFFCTYSVIEYFTLQIRSSSIFCQFSVFVSQENSKQKNTPSLGMIQR